MARTRIVLLHKDIRRLLQSEAFATPINDLAYAMAADIDDDSIVVSEYTTDRAAAAVAAPGSMQAKDGVLTRAAAKVGLEVRAKP